MKKPGIITITTDFGLTDHYVGVMKGVILNINPDAKIVDISNSIAKFSLRQANFILSQSYKYFPKGTVHLAVVDPGVGSDRNPLIIQTNDSFFVGPDNGVFSFLKDEEIKNIIRIEKRFMEKTSTTFHGRDIFAPASALLSLGEEVDKFGSGLKEIERIGLNGPSLSENPFYGKIIHIDSFGNLVTDIDSESFRKASENKRVSAIINHRETKFFVNNYAEAGEDFFLIEGSSGLIEISIKKGSAADLLNAGIEDKIEITLT